MPLERILKGREGRSWGRWHAATVHLYARKNRPDVDDLVRDLDALGWQTWVDSSLRGGQAWWEEILRRIADCDVFLVIVSRHTLSSVACKRELQWALALNKPVLPVAVERRPDALPRSLSMRQIVDYFQPGKKAAFALAGGLTTLPPAPPLPEQLPEPPPAPLSYLSDLVDQVSQPDPLTHEQQHQILNQLQRALRSADPEERGGGRYVLETFSNRHDLYADVDRTLAQLGLAEHDTQPPGWPPRARTSMRRPSTTRLCRSPTRPRKLHTAAPPGGRHSSTTRRHRRRHRVGGGAG